LPASLPEEALLPAIWDPIEKQARLLLNDNVGIDLAAATISFYPGKRDASMILASSMLLGEIDEYPRKSVKDDYALAILEHKPSVEVSYSVNAIGNKSAVGVYLDPTGLFFVHYVLVPDAITIDAFEEKFFADLRTTLRLADSQGRTLFEQEKSIPLDMQKDELRAVEKSSFQLYDAFPVIPGTHTLHLLFENTISKEFTTIERTIVVPEPAEFNMSPILLARKAFKVAPAPGGPSRAFQIGAFQLYPSVSNQFPEKERIFLFFQLYGLPRAILEAGQVEATISYEGKSVQAVRKPVPDFENGRNFLIDLPTDKLPAGTYVLRAGVLDPNGREVMAAETSLQMTTRGAPGTWVVAQTNPPAYDPFYSYVLGTQYFNKGDLERAAPFLDKAHANDAKNLDYAIGYARVLLARQEPAKAREVLLRLVGPEAGTFALYETLGQASERTGEVKEAVSWYERALTFRGNVVEVLNALGDCHLALRNPDQALKAWTRSLEISPNQEAIKKKIADLKR
jgi:tetratricopeptide (TPR) repeat protein